MYTKYFLYFTVTITCLFNFSCSPKLNPDYNTGLTEKILYPRYADTARFQYLKGFSANTDIEIQSKFDQALTGIKKVEFMSKPYGVTVEKSKVYVADIGLPGVNIIDLEKKTFKQFKPIHRDFTFILSMAVDSNDDLYLLDTKTMTVIIYDVDGKLKDQFKVPENLRPVRIKIKDDKIYIGDIGTGKIYIYSKETHELIDQIPKKEVVEGDKNFVYMVMDFDLTDRHIYILDAGEYKVKVFTIDGELVSSFGENGKGYGQFVRPKGIAVDKEGYILVSDAATNAVQLFNKDGQSLMAFGMPYGIEAGKNVPGLYLPGSIIIDYHNLDYYKPYIDSKYNLKYVVYVMNQFGVKKLKAYGRLELKPNQNQ
ncbi:6-bladed beta-propeller [Aestuariivivens sp. NBU2969]|uniref:6-bladed beta-propeller n=1 Tax=Aestuariivivens sp. NBU2969 TaxID=2873267 RepID=UPI001CBD8DDE|nr:6-bladed beta-propeller [Aestuariivivens sp. NBU2969]